MKQKYLFTTLLLCLSLILFAGCGAKEDAADTETKSDTVTPAEITVYSDAQLTQNCVIYRELTVGGDLAESYGFNDGLDVDTVSALDVLVALHEEKYGDSFTADTCGDYLAVSKEGWISKAFEEETDSWSVMINGEAAHSDQTSSYGGFEALNINQSPVAEGDTVEFVVYADTTNYSDLALWFLKDGEKVTALEAAVGEDIALTVEGYTFSFYGSYGTEAIAKEYLAPVGNLQLGTLAEDGTTTALSGTVTAEDGTVSVSFDEAGTYVLAAYAPAGGETFTFLAPLRITVK